MKRAMPNASPAVEDMPLQERPVLGLSQLVWRLGTRFARRLERLDIHAGQTVLLLGASGSGKTSLLNLISGIAAPESGEIDLLGQSLVQARPALRDRLRGDHIGLIFQQLNLLPYASVAQNIALGLRFSPARQARLDRPIDQAIAETLQALDLAPEMAQEAAQRLSIGQQQRVAAARALIGAPELILADEPTSALDPANRDRFFELLFASMDRRRQAALVVSHDPSLQGLFERVLRMEDLVQDAAPLVEEAVQ